VVVRYVVWGGAWAWGVGVLALLAGCSPTYSPNTYDSAAVQQAAKVDQGIVVGVREVAVSANTTVGTVTGAAAGGIAGSQVGGGVTSAFGALGGSVLGGIAGSAAQHVEGDTKAFEYIVRKANGDLISVTQTDTQPLTLGQHVLVIDGKQARIVPDYTTPVAAAKPLTVVPPPAVPPPAVPTGAAVPPVPPPPTVIDPAAAAPAQSAPVQTTPVQTTPAQPTSAPIPPTPAAGPSPTTAPTPLMPPGQPPSP
jgi:outer membrane lipoprotein SlyB